MFFRLSLKYRIALVIFLLEAIMMTAVLWNTTDEALNAARKHQQANHNVILTLLSELSRTALLTEEYSDLQLYFEQIENQPDIENIILTDTNDHIVVSSTIDQIGQTLPNLNDTQSLYWRNNLVDSEAGNLGLIALQFTNKSLFSASESIRRQGITTAAIGMSIILAIGLMVGFALTRRLERITQAAKDFANGKLDAQSKITGFDELGTLGKTFDHMVIDVSNKQQELEKHQQHLENLVDQRTKTIREQAQIINQIHDSIILTDLKGIIKTWNNGAKRLFGYHESETLGQHIEFIYPENEQELLTDRISHLQKEGNYESEVKMYRKNGEIFYGHLSLSLQRDENNNPIGMIGYSMDITARKNAENELLKRTKQLEVSNKELEAFSYSVSHDLRSPLRGIHGYSSALIEDYNNQLDDNGKRMLERIQKNSIRMGHLIDDLLKLSRISRRQVKKSETDLSYLAKGIISRLHNEEPHRKIDINIEDNLKSRCDKDLLHIALENLFGNAWKYTSKKDKAKIEFGIKNIDNKEVFYIKDNGAGFDMAYSNKLFGAFQRLHHANEFEGTGIGLATVSRIIHRHYGRIWAEAEVNKGATFYFELPK